MHGSVLQFIHQQVVELDLGDRATLEVGSLNVNGSARRYFGGPYVGIDMQDGPGVDIVMNAHDLSTLRIDTLDGRTIDSKFDVIVCTEMLEHDDQPWVTMRQMYGVCVDGGYLLLTCRGFDRRGCFPVHEYPRDLWRFSVEGVVALLASSGWELILAKQDPDAPGVFAIAMRSERDEPTQRQSASTAESRRG